MSNLQMLTQEEVAAMLHAHVTTITTLREVGVLPAIKTGKNFMFSQDTLRKFQHDYAGYDVSNRVKAIEAYNLVNKLQGGY